MARHVDGYRDEWAGVLDDPEKLSRFVSFVNAPDRPDPTVAFDDSGARKVPVLIGMPAVPAAAPAVPVPARRPLQLCLAPQRSWCRRHSLRSGNAQLNAEETPPN